LALLESFMGWVRELAGCQESVQAKCDAVATFLIAVLPRFNNQTLKKFEPLQNSTEEAEEEPRIAPMGTDEKILLGKPSVPIRKIRGESLRNPCRPPFRRGLQLTRPALASLRSFMKPILSLSRATALLAAISLASASFAQPPPSGPGGPYPGGPGGPGGPGPGRGPGGPIPIVPIPGRPLPPPVDDGSSLVAQVQRKLKRLGYYEGPVDGDLGRGTRGAIRAFQGEHELAITGSLDRPTLRALGL
jgi:hypothetical protein